jgi:alpha-beta hydrolase superfamily lysophospholipase
LRTSAARHPKAFYLRGDHETAFVLFHEPVQPRTDAAVVMCPPFGLDPMSPHRGRRDWAEHLASRGHPTVRMDLPGSGDSPGGPRDVGRLDAWTDAVSVTARWLRTTAGVSRIVAAGVGLGGLVAYRAASQGPCIDDLVLWGVPARGRSLVRELRAYSQLPSSKALPRDGHEPSSLLEDGDVLSAGYLLSAETASTLEALDLTQLHLANVRRRRMLLVGRSGPRVDAQLRTFLEQEGAEVTVTSGPGYRANSDFLGRVDSWLAAGDPRRSLCVQPGGIRPSEEELPPVPAPRPSVRGHLELIRPGPAVRETPMWIEGAGEHLFGVLAESQQPARLTALLLTAGALPHTGPCRLWVTIAREWAARGVSTLRFDMPGIGDSTGMPGAPGESNYYELMPLSAPEYLDAVSAALDALESRGLPNRFVLVGLCSGAYWALHTALRDSRVAAAVMLNPPALLWNDEVDATYRTVQRRRLARSLRDRLLLGATWHKVLGGEISPRRCLTLAYGIGVRSVLDACRQVLSPAPEYGGAGARSQSAALLDALRDREQTVLLMLAGDEPLREELAASGLLNDAGRWPNLELVLTGKAEDEAQVFTSLSAQHYVLKLADELLSREIERALPCTAFPTTSATGPSLAP